MTSAPTPTLEPRSGSSPGAMRRLLVATIVGLLAGFTLFVFFGGDPEPSGGDAAEESLTGPGGPSVEPGNAPAPTVTELSLGDDAAMKCMVPNVKILKQQSLAFEGTVNAMNGRQVTLDVKTWFRGEPTEQVVVRAASPQLRLALSGVEFKEGPTYLVSANDGQVTMCGFSAEANPELAALFAEAYAE
jgi:hypothetical protein